MTIKGDDLERVLNLEIGDYVRSGNRKTKCSDHTISWNILIFLKKNAFNASLYGNAVNKISKTEPF